LEDVVLDALTEFRSLKILFLYSKAHHSGTAMSVTRHRAQAISTESMEIMDHIQVAAVGGEEEYRWVNPTTPAPNEECSIPVLAEIALQASPRTMASDGSMYMVPFDSVVGGVTIGSVDEPSVIALEVVASLPSALGFNIKRKLRKPFKSRALLASVVSLLQEVVEDVVAGATPTVLPLETAESALLLAEAGLLRGHPVIQTVLSGLDATFLVPVPTSSALSLLQATQLKTQLAAVVPGPRKRVTSNRSTAPVESNRARIVNISNKYPLRILLAEDNLINQKMMVMLLRKLGYEIDVASNGQHCLEILDQEAKKGRAHEIQVVLMDATMDVMDGMECTRCIRSQQLPQRIRPFIIAQTANVSEEYRTSCFDSGMDLFTSVDSHSVSRSCSGVQPGARVPIVCCL
jgi:CheY-like chemotaxis protein